MATDDRPIPRKRRPRPAPDAGIDPMDTTPAAAPTVATNPTFTPRPSESVGVVQTRGTKVTTKTPAGRAEVQLGARISVPVFEHLESVIAATGRTKKELLEIAIMALQAPSTTSPD